MVATLLKSSLAKLNINLSVQSLAWPTQWAKGKSAHRRQHQDIFLEYWWPDYADPYSWFTNLLQTQKQPYFNLSYYSDPTLDTQINRVESLVATSQAGRRSAVPDHAGGDPAAPRRSCPVQRQLPVRDAQLVHRAPGRPGVPERGLRLQPEADRQLIVYVVRRVATAVLVVAGVVVLTFVIAQVVPGDPAATWAGPHASAAQVAAARRFLGLDRPPPVQLASYFGGIVTGNWGVSIHTHRPVLSDIGHAAPASIELVIAALIIALVVGRPARADLGPLARPGQRPAIRAGSILGRVHADLLAGAHPPAGLRPSGCACCPRPASSPPACCSPTRCPG